ncbi:conjugative transposon TraN protein [Pontibacter ummariensis]|uniref:Bacteroides conjugative transposon TraN protein n=1 Tax=Pontibacter ummariensis TaxID=1610492 RepID=A0A239LK42_9BACT|nr:conjugative transposon protein TraN [Pontibacter ummariensis]PRY02756.1 conjugative transposon TraN protein [Pontibacter ummariensis]SNT30946.1 Bacteroides conjugative transposon TraN protein [Pontibacter ummariensis]
MNKNSFTVLLCFLLCQLTGMAQSLQQDFLKLALTKTTSLIFPYAIQSVDRGSSDILAQIPSQVGNVLHVKAARAGFPETNLTVITTDGNLYSFPVRYADNPERTLIRLDASPMNTASVLFTNAAFNEKQLETIAKNLVRDSKFYYGIRDKKGGARAAVEGIYIHDNTLFYRVVLTNKSPLPYKLDFSRFTVHDRKQARRTATQAQVLSALYTYEDKAGAVEAGQRKVLVFALQKHALMNGKELVLDLFEKGGGRHLKLRVRKRDLRLACPLILESYLLNNPVKESLITKP